jgi:methylase of polypeptide subunit release factors
MLEKLIELGERLEALGYRFTTVSPSAQRLVNARPGAERARTLRDVFGWNRPFQPEILGHPLFELTVEAGGCTPISGTELWRPTLRFSTLGDLLFVHSPFPTVEQDSVFFGPDSVRFSAAIARHAPAARRIVDVGAGTGVGGIVLGTERRNASVVLTDVNPRALRLAEVNAHWAGIPVETVESDVLNAVRGEFDLVIANPPFLRDGAARAYRHGGGRYGEGLAVRIAAESMARLARNRAGGTLLLYSGAAIVEGEDQLLCALRAVLDGARAHFSYEELDPDIFSDELAEPTYAEVERIAAVFLQVRVAGSG